MIFESLKSQSYIEYKTYTIWSFYKKKKKSFFWSYKVISQNFPKLLSTIYGSVGVHVKIHRQGDKPSFKRMHEKCQKPKLFGLLSSVAAAAAARSYEIGSYKDWFFFRCYWIILLKIWFLLLLFIIVLQHYIFRYISKFLDTFIT